MQPGHLSIPPEDLVYITAYLQEAWKIANKSSGGNDSAIVPSLVKILQQLDEMHIRSRDEGTQGQSQGTCLIHRTPTSMPNQKKMIAYILSKLLKGFCPRKAQEVLCACGKGTQNTDAAVLALGIPRRLGCSSTKKSDSNSDLVSKGSLKGQATRIEGQNSFSSQNQKTENRSSSAVEQQSHFGASLFDRYPSFGDNYQNLTYGLAGSPQGERLIEVGQNHY